MSTYKGTTYHGIKLDLENNFYWFQPDRLKNFKNDEPENYKIGQKLDIRELWKRYENSELSFGFGKETKFDNPVEDCLNSVLETIVTDIDRDYVQVEYFRCAPYVEKRQPIKVDEGGYDDTDYDVDMLSGFAWWHVDCFYRDIFILKGAWRELVKEDDFSVCYEDGGNGDLTIHIGSMTLDFWINIDKHRYCEEYEVLGWQIEEKDDCTILSIDLQAHYCPSAYDICVDPPYDVFEDHWEAEARIEEAEAEYAWDDVTTFDGECSVVVKFPGKPRLNYNYNGLISVGDKVMVSGKLAGLVGTVVRIEEQWEGDYVQNVVEIVESAGDEDDDDEWDDDDE